MLTVGSLFSGIGGIELGLERAGMRTLWQVEISPFCRAVLEKHWPDVERFEDVRSVGAGELPRVDLIAGGFPCQDLSYAGKGAGIKEGTRSGLWFEFARIIRELRPRYVLVENVPALRSRGLHVVLGDLAACGYDAEWDCIPAAAVGAPHRRDRIWLLAYPHADDAGLEGRYGGILQERPGEQPLGALGPHPYANRRGLAQQPKLDGGEAERTVEGPRRDDALGLRYDLADAIGGSPQLQRGPGSMASTTRGAESEKNQRQRGGDAIGNSREDLADTDEGGRSGRARIFRPGRWPELANGGSWIAEPAVGRVADGVPSRVDRLTALGNSVVPQVAELVGRRIVEAEAQSGVS